MVLSQPMVLRSVREGSLRSETCFVQASPIGREITHEHNLEYQALELH